MLTLPVIDLQSKDLQSSLKNLLEASTYYGCFRVVNHGIPDDLQSDMKAAVKALSDLPVDVKSRNVHVIHGSGYVGPIPANPIYESFGLYDVTSPVDIDDFCTKMNALDHIRETMKKYAENFHKVIVDIAKKLADSMGLVNYYFDEWPCQMRMNKYHYTKETINRDGIQIHTDSGFLTLLQEDDCVGGFEVLDPSSGTYVEVNSLPGSLLVNLGDVAKAWSNGILHNVKHRVICKAAVERFSIAFFLLAQKDDMVEVPMGLIDSEHPRLYRTFKYDDYRKLHFLPGNRAGEGLSQMQIMP